MFPKVCSLHSFYFQNDRTIQGQADFHDLCFSPTRLICLMALAGLLIHCYALIIDEESPFANTRDKSTINVSIIDSPLKKPDFLDSAINSSVTLWKFPVPVPFEPL